MTARPWMPLYVADYLADTLDLDAEQSGAYLLMLMIAWRRPDGALPNDLLWLKRALSSCVRDMHGNRFNKIVPPLLARYFVLGEDGKFRQNRLTKELEKTAIRSEKQRENAEKRWSKTKENNELGNAGAVPSHSHSHTQSESKKEDKDASLRSDVRERERVIELEFEDWYAGYPHKVGRAQALKAFKAARLRKGATVDDLRAGRDRYITSKPADISWCNPATFLNGERWKDQPAAAVATRNGHGPPRRGPQAMADFLQEQILAQGQTNEQPAEQEFDLDLTANPH